MKQVLKDWKQFKHVHLVGVGGTLMGAFAAFLKRQGLRVTGSDGEIYPPMSDVLKEAGVEVTPPGHRPENLQCWGAPPDLVVIGNVIRADNPEAQWAIQAGWAYTSLPEAMEHFFLKTRCNFVVAGTHGKTTTSSLLAHTFVVLGKHPSYFIGGVCLDLPQSFHVDPDERGYFVLEGDEYDTAFWDKVPKFNHYLPDQVVLTSVEYDHADIYPDLPAVERAFEGLLQRIRPGGGLIACWEHESVRKLVLASGRPGVGYGLSPQPSQVKAAQGGGLQSYFYATQIREVAGRTCFQVRQLGRENSVLAEISLQIPGEHNVLNALAVWIQTQQLGLPSESVVQALSSFRGVKRRQEVRGEVRGVLVIDDFAHHPTAVSETLKALRHRYSGRRLIAVFEPRSATSRRKVFQKPYVSAFSEADAVYLAQPYDQSRIQAQDQFSSAQLVDDLIQRGQQAYLFERVEEGVSLLASHTRPQDLIAVLSNGGFGGFIPQLLAVLQHPREPVVGS
jgi:UDP-N-acetylmuramate: L-alanyl-gamma-D-glutamyl-meso-diaminopimelate ligase